MKERIEQLAAGEVLVKKPELDFSPAYLNMCYNDDALYAIPFQISTYMMYYNKDLFEQAGIEEVPTTFDQWTED